ncbi:hypothetical protein GTP91_12660 [Rugamonas sp. FT82W]|uniref:PIN domain-containing protein n=1 Tax=Duganella vulcania TaxID=2692166 RepID=A0A845G4N1_9BURK|nr:hypothetical protein [Duganella vulcania]MYM88026.1 hypothetical protein [Duganella vulcania]
MSDRLLIDTNLLLVMIIGAVDGGRYIEKSKRLGRFCVEDYDRLWELVAEYKEVWITPYIAAEVSNLIDLDRYAREKAFEIARGIFGIFNQAPTSISEDCKSEFFIDFGLTDSSIINLSRDFDILTNDQRLWGPLYAANPDSVIPYIPVKPC